MNTQRARLLRTPAMIAAEVGEPIQRILRILESRPHIQPVARDRRTRLYSVHAVAQVRREIEAQNARRAGGPS